MGREDVGAALQAMSDNEEVRDRVAAGDFTDLPDTGLTEAERAMVTAAAEDFPDVEGFAQAQITVDPKTGDSGGFGDISLLSPGLRVAVDYWKVEKGESWKI